MVDTISRIKCMVYRISFQTVISGYNINTRSNDKFTFNCFPDQLCIHKPGIQVISGGVFAFLHVVFTFHTKLG